MESNLQQPVQFKNLAEATIAIALLQTQVEGLMKTVAELTAPKNTEVKDMTDDHARQILTGDLKDKKHNEAAKILGLSYGQVYSCRLEYTFKHIHKEMKEAGIKNGWAK